MAIDYWTLTKDYKVGDLVQKFIPGLSSLSPYVGKVTAVMQGIGFLDVQWPFGNERVSPEEVVRINPDFSLFTPPTLTPSYYPGMDAGPAAKIARTSNGSPMWATTEVPPTFHRELAKAFHKGASALEAYDRMWHLFRQANDEALRSETIKFYRVASNLVTLFLSEYATKTAAYWATKDRKYRATKPELETRTLTCPKCKEATMRRTTYKMEDGIKARLFACPSCLYLIKQSDILGPDGNGVEW